MARDILDEFAVTEIELLYRNKLPAEERYSVRTAETAYEIFLKSWDRNKIDLVEQFKVMLLDNRCSCLGISHISTGGIAHCLTDPRLIFAAAIKGRATQIILAHNHPSGNLEFSEEDKRLTSKLVEGGKFLDIRVSDHLVVTPYGFKSFAQELML